jgi:hypothetical protein
VDWCNPTTLPFWNLISPSGSPAAVLGIKFWQASKESKDTGISPFGQIWELTSPELNTTVIIIIHFIYIRPSGMIGS